MSKNNVEFAVLGSIGPNDLHIPAQPGHLKQALNHIQHMSDQLDSVFAELEKAAGDEDVRGETAFSLQRVVRFSRFTARRDNRMLQELKDAVEHEVQVLHEIQGEQLERLRSRWEDARQEFIVAAKAAKQQHPHQLAEHLDGEAGKPYAPLFHRLTGVNRDLGGGDSFLMVGDPELEDSIQQYRHRVHAILEEFESAVRTVRRAEEEIHPLLHWEQRQKEEDPEGKSDTKIEKDPAGISGPRVLHRMLDALESGAGSLNRLEPTVKAIDNAIAQGMLPDHDDQSRAHIFQREWEEHLQRRIRRMRTVVKTASQMANELRRLDSDTASQIFQENQD